MGVPGLRLNLGGAPETPHVIDGVPGLYWPTHHTPLDVIGIDAERAKQLHDDLGVPLEYGEIPDEATAQVARDRYAAELDASAKAGADASAPVGGEADVRAAQVLAITPVPEAIPVSEPTPEPDPGQTETE